MGEQIPRARRLPAVAAGAWCAVFAALHLFWALGGSTGLASSAGRDLAERRPAAFVVFGLCGVAVLLVGGIGVLWVADGRTGSRGWTRRAVVCLGLVGAVLTLRGVLLEVLLWLDAGGLRTAVGTLETRWSLALWDPWFVLGGVLFLWTAAAAASSASRT